MHRFFHSHFLPFGFQFRVFYRLLVKFAFSPSFSFSSSLPQYIYLIRNRRAFGTRTATDTSLRHFPALYSVLDSWYWYIWHSTSIHLSIPVWAMCACQPRWYTYTHTHCICTWCRYNSMHRQLAPQSRFDLGKRMKPVFLSFFCSVGRCSFSFFLSFFWSGDDFFPSVFQSVTETTSTRREVSWSNGASLPIMWKKVEKPLFREKKHIHPTNGASFSFSLNH